MRASNWFNPAPYLDAKGEQRRAFELTRDGFTLLVNRWTGPKALAFQIKYIQAFNRMEAQLRAGQTAQPMSRVEAFAQAVLMAKEEIDRLQAAREQDAKALEVKDQIIEQTVRQVEDLRTEDEKKAKVIKHQTADLQSHGNEIAVLKPIQSLLCGGLIAQAPPGAGRP